MIAIPHLGEGAVAAFAALAIFSTVGVSEGAQISTHTALSGEKHLLCAVES